MFVKENDRLLKIKRSEYRLSAYALHHLSLSLPLSVCSAWNRVVRWYRCYDSTPITMYTYIVQHWIFILFLYSSIHLRFTLSILKLRVSKRFFLSMILFWKCWDSLWKCFEFQLEPLFVICSITKSNNKAITVFVSIIFSAENKKQWSTTEWPFHT